MLGYEPNLYTIIINIGLVFVLFPRVKKSDSQSGEKAKVTWLFLKKPKIIN